MADGLDHERIVALRKRVKELEAEQSRLMSELGKATTSYLQMSNKLNTIREAWKEVYKMQIGDKWLSAVQNMKDALKQQEKGGE